MKMKINKILNSTETLETVYIHTGCSLNEKIKDINSNKNEFINCRENTVI